MKSYSIFTSPQGSHRAVKQGWSWPAFFFGFIWALTKRMWMLSICLFFLFVVLGAIEAWIEISSGTEASSVFSALVSLFTLFVVIAFGVNGNYWRENKLMSSGFDYRDTVSANNPEAAIALWIEQCHDSS